MIRGSEFYPGFRGPAGDVCLRRGIQELAVWIRLTGIVPTLAISAHIVDVRHLRPGVSVRGVSGPRTGRALPGARYAPSTDRLCGRKRVSAAGAVFFGGGTGSPPVAPYFGDVHNTRTPESFSAIRRVRKKLKKLREVFDPHTPPITSTQKCLTKMYTTGIRYYFAVLIGCEIIKYACQPF